MGKRAPKLPIASAERSPFVKFVWGPQQLSWQGRGWIKVTISDGDWRRIESAYGRELSPEARRDIREKTQEFVDRAEFEQNAEPVSDARDRITIIERAASSLRSALDGGDRDADIYARTLIKKHLRKVGDAIKKRRRKKDAIKKRRRKKDDPLRGISSDIRVLIFASQDALRELDDAKDQGFSKGEAWERWIRRLTSIAKAHNLPGGARKDSDKKSGSSPFFELVWELQQSVPKAHRRYSRGALAGAIVGARRQNRVG